MVLEDSIKNRIFDIMDSGIVSEHGILEEYVIRYNELPEEVYLKAYRNIYLGGIGKQIQKHKKINRVLVVILIALAAFEALSIYTEAKELQEQNSYIINSR